VGIRGGIAAVQLAMVLCVLCGVTASIAIPQKPSSTATTKAKPTPPPEARLDINHASVDQLLKVPGMTASWAGRIVRFRPYRTRQDLVDRGVLPSDVYDRIKDYVIAHREKQ